MELLNLTTTERMTALKDEAGVVRFHHFFKPITNDDWIEHERRTRPGLKVESDTESRSQSHLVEANNWLWEKRIARVEGYGDSPLEAVPLMHRYHAVDGLSLVWVAEDQEILPTAASIPVALEARWNGANYAPLVHFFQRPKIEHELRYQEGQRRTAYVSKRIGGQRRPQAPQTEIVSLPRLEVMLKLYGELIERLEGYEPDDPTKMDAMHQMVAIRELFGRDERISIELGEPDDVGAVREPPVPAVAE